MCFTALPDDSYYQYHVAQSAERITLFGINTKKIPQTHTDTHIVFCVALAGSNTSISIWKTAAGRCSCHCCCSLLCYSFGWHFFCSCYPSLYWCSALRSLLSFCVSPPVCQSCCFLCIHTIIASRQQWREVQYMYVWGVDSNIWCKHARCVKVTHTLLFRNS